MQPEELDKIILRVFSSADGTKVLKFLKEQYLEKECWTPGNDPSYGFYRDGENAVVRDIIKRMVRATKL
jgi:hypothetical protein